MPNNFIVLPIKNQFSPWLLSILKVKGVIWLIMEYIK